MKFVVVFLLVLIACATASPTEYFKDLKRTFGLKPKITPPPTNYCALAKMNKGNINSPEIDIWVKHWQEKCARQSTNSGKP